MLGFTKLLHCSVSTSYGGVTQFHYITELLAQFHRVKCSYMLSFTTWLICSVSHFLRYSVSVTDMLSLTKLLYCSVSVTDMLSFKKLLSYSVWLCFWVTRSVSQSYWYAQFHKVTELLSFTKKLIFSVYFCAY